MADQKKVTPFVWDLGLGIFGVADHKSKLKIQN